MAIDHRLRQLHKLPSMAMDFEWDERKAAGNLAKHGLAFEDAVALFLSPGAITIDTSREIDTEKRWKLVAPLEGRLQTVVYTKRGKTIRLISARPANAAERKAYDGYRALHP